MPRLMHWPQDSCSSWSGSSNSSQTPQFDMNHVIFLDDYDVYLWAGVNQRYTGWWTGRVPDWIWKQRHDSLVLWATGIYRTVVFETVWVIPSQHTAPPSLVFFFFFKDVREEADRPDFILDSDRSETLCQKTCQGRGVRRKQWRTPNDMATV